MARKRDYRTIGEVVDELRPAFPDVTISKLRFLEEEGLVAPERTAGGYRKYSNADVSRLRLVLKLQREHFLPLSVIREKLKDFDRGRVPPELRPVAASVEAVTLPFEDSEPMQVEQVPNLLGLPVSFVRELAEYGLVTVQAGTSGDELSRADVEVLHACWDLRRFGVEPRHLRMYETFGQREASLFSQILMPAFRHRTPETRQKLVETLDELARLTSELKERLLRRSVGAVFEDSL